MMQRAFITILIILLVLTPVLANAHMGHTHNLGYLERGYDTSQCTDHSHYNGLHRCDVFVLYNQSLSLLTSFSIDKHDDSRILAWPYPILPITTRQLAVPASRAPPLFS